MLTRPQSLWRQPSVNGHRARCLTRSRAKPRSKRSHLPPHSRFRARQNQELLSWGARGLLNQVDNGHGTYQTSGNAGRLKGKLVPGWRGFAVPNSGHGGPLEELRRTQWCLEAALSAVLCAGAFGAAIYLQHLLTGRLRRAAPRLHEKAEPGLQQCRSPPLTGREGPGLLR